MATRLARGEAEGLNTSVGGRIPSGEVRRWLWAVYRFDLAFFVTSQISIASMCFAYAINIGVLRKGCVLQHKRGTPHRKAECGAGVTYQRHRATILARLPSVGYQVRIVRAATA